LRGSIDDFLVKIANLIQSKKVYCCALGVGICKADSIAKGFSAFLRMLTRIRIAPAYLAARLRSNR
jgi:hypothetical protein